MVTLRYKKTLDFLSLRYSAKNAVIFQYIKLFSKIFTHSYNQRIPFSTLAEPLQLNPPKDFLGLAMTRLIRKGF